MSEAVYPLSSVAVAVTVIFLLVVKYWKKIKELLIDCTRFYSFGRDFWFINKKVNPAMKQSFQKVRKRDPIAMAYCGFLPLVFRYSPRSKKISIVLKEGIAVATIPSVDLGTIAEALKKHIDENLSHTSIVKGIKKLQDAVDLATLTLLLEKTGFDGSFTIALRKILDRQLGDADVKRLYNCSLAINRELESEKAFEWMERRFLRMILLEMYKLEGGGTFGMVT